MIYPNFYQTWDVISVLLSKEVKLRYRGTALGILAAAVGVVVFVWMFVSVIVTAREERATSG